jgi:hypothetical protein
MDTTTLIQILTALVVTGLSWWMTTMWKESRELAIKLTALELLLVREYHTKEHADKLFDDVHKRLETVTSLEVLMAQSEVRRTNTDARLKSIDDRLDTLLKEVLNAKN